MAAREPRADGSLPSIELRSRLDEYGPDAMRATPYPRRAARTISGRRICAATVLGDKMRAHRLDCVIAPGGLGRWSFGDGMLRVAGHREWPSLAGHGVVPLVGDPALVHAMGGTHIEATKAMNASTPYRGT